MLPKTLFNLFLYSSGITWRTVYSLTREQPYRTINFWHIELIGWREKCQMMINSIK